MPKVSCARATLLSFCLAISVLSGQTPSGPDGRWEGVIRTPGPGLNVTVRLTGAANGAWTGTIDIPAQAAYNLPLTLITISLPSVSFVMSGVGGSPTFTGTLSGDGTMTGTFKQGTAEFPFVLTKKAEPDSLPASRRRPQEPTPPLPYNEVQVTYKNLKGDVTLAGTLTEPRTSKPIPAVVLITGSGAEDRDETVFGHKPFQIGRAHV